MADLASSVDAHVGKRIRLLRGLRKFSQEKLARALGITFQQVQKYERGANRVGAGRLYQLAKILNVPVGFFFDELDSFATQTGLHEEQAPFHGAEEDGESAGAATSGSVREGGIEMLMQPETLELAQAYYRIRDSKVRQQLLNFIRDVADRS